MAARRSELDVMTVGVNLDTDRALAQLRSFISRKLTINADIDVKNLEKSFTELTRSLSVARSRLAPSVRGLAYRNAVRVSEAISGGVGPSPGAGATEDAIKAFNVRAVAAQSAERLVANAAAKLQRPYLPRGQFVYGATGKGAGSPTGSQWDYTSTADYNRQKGIVPRQKYMATQVAAEEEATQRQDQRDIRARSIYRARARTREQARAADVQMSADRDQLRSEIVTNAGIGQRHRARKEQSSLIQERADQEQLRSESMVNAGIGARYRARQASTAGGISSRESYVALRQDMINRPGLGGALARSMEAAQARYTQTGSTGGGIGGALFGAKMAMGPGLASVGRLASPIMSGMSSMMSGIASMSATIGSSMLSIGKSVVAHGVGVARTLMSLPSMAFRSMTMIRHAFWNLTFMAGLAAGGAYAVAKALGPAGQVELWQNQFATLLGLQRGFKGRRATEAGQGMAKERIGWITQEALTMKATIPEAVETGRYLTVHNIFSKRMFRLAADLEQSFSAPLEEIVRPFMYLKNQRFGQFLRLGAKFGMTPLAMKEEGIDMAPVLKPRLRTQQWYSTVYEKMAFRMERMYGGMREVTAQGYVTKLSNLSDAWFKLRADIGASALPAAKGAIDAMTKAMANIATRFKGADFSGVGNLAVRGINYAADVITSKHPLQKLGGDINGMWTGPEGLGQALSTTFTNLLGHLPNYMKSTWDRLSEVLKTGADWLTKVFETLPSYWERFALTLKMSLGDMFTNIGTTLTDMGGMYAPFGTVAKAIGGAFQGSAVDQAANKGRLGTELNRKLAYGTMYAPDIDVGLAGKRTLMPDLPKNATPKEREHFGIVKQRLHQAIAEQDWETAGALYSRATDIQQGVVGRNTFFAAGRYGGGPPPVATPLTQMQEAQQARSLRRKFQDLGYPEVMSRISQGLYPYPGMPGVGSVGGAAIEPAGMGMLSADISPLSIFMRNVMAPDTVSAFGDRIPGGGLNFQHNTPGELQNTWSTISLLGGLTSMMKMKRMKGEQGSLPFAALDRIDREAALSAGTSMSYNQSIETGKQSSPTDTITDTILGTSRGLQSSADKQVDALKEVKTVLEVIQDYLK